MLMTKRQEKLSEKGLLNAALSATDCPEIEHWPPPWPADDWHLEPKHQDRLIKTTVVSVRINGKWVHFHLVIYKIRKRRTKGWGACHRLIWIDNLCSNISNITYASTYRILECDSVHSGMQSLLDVMLWRNPIPESNDVNFPPPTELQTSSSRLFFIIRYSALLCTVSSDNRKITTTFYLTASQPSI